MDYDCLQLEASMNEELHHKIPMFNLPSQILCQVVNAHLLVIAVLGIWWLILCLCFLDFFLIAFGHALLLYRLSRRPMKFMHTLLYNRYQM